MQTLAHVAPDFVVELKRALEAKGKTVLAKQVEAAKIERCTYDASMDAGYIYFDRPAPGPHVAKLAAPVAATFTFAGPHWFNIDVDHDGHLFGIELLSSRGRNC